MADSKAQRGGLSIGKRLLFSAVVLLALLALVEIGVRIVWDPPESALAADGILMEANPTRIWSLPEGDHVGFGASYSVDAQGLRRVNTTGARFKVLTTGDSSIFGHGLEDADTLHASLAQAFVDRGVSVDVYCGGVPGYSSEQTLVMLEEAGWPMEPDLLVVGNLWSDNDIRFFSDREWLDQLEAPAYSLGRLLEASHAFRLARRTAEPPADEELPVGWVRDPYATGHRRVPLTDYARNVDTILLQAAQRGVSVVMLSPCNRILSDPTWDRPTAWGDYFEAMQRVADRRGVPIVSACQLLQSVGISADDAFLDEMHPTGITNRLYARAIGNVLARGGWPFNPILPDATLPVWDEELHDHWNLEANKHESVLSGEYVVPDGPKDGGAPQIHNVQPGQ